MAYYEHLLKCFYSDKESYIDDIAKTYDGMGYVYKYRGMSRKAKECFEKGISILEESYEEDTVTLLGIYNDLCNLYDNLNLPNEAVELRKDILGRVTALYGSEHYNVMVAKSNLANAYGDIGEYGTAVKLYEECTDWARDNLGSGHSETVRNMRCLSRIYMKIGRYDEALKIAYEVYGIMAKALGEYHIDVLMMLEDIAFCTLNFIIILRQRRSLHGHLNISLNTAERIRIISVQEGVIFMSVLYREKVRG